MIKPSSSMSRSRRITFVLAIFAVIAVIYYTSAHASGSTDHSASADWLLGNIPSSWRGSSDTTPSSSYQKPDSEPTSPPQSQPSNAVVHDTTPTEDEDPYEFVKPLTTDSHFINWLSKRVPTDRVPFITIGDCKYVHALRNFRHQLDTWGYGDDLVVICLDHCCADGRGYHSYSRYIGETVAFVKFSINLDLTAHGYNFVFLDGDVYLTGASDPFSHMRPLSNDSWDFQVQTDHEGVFDYNIGWYFSRANHRTYDFYLRSYAQWNETQEWDQKVMNDVGKVMEEENRLRVHHLPWHTFRNFMAYAWEPLCDSGDDLQTFINTSTIIHFTCIEQSLKTYFGYYFGGFGDLDNYYSDPPPLLGVRNIAGTVTMIQAQVALAATLSKGSHRTFMWPDVVDVLQRRMDESGHRLVLERIQKQPGVRVMDWDSGAKAGLAAVEADYLENMRRVTGKTLEAVVFGVPHWDLQALKQQITDVEMDKVVILDFQGFTPEMSQESAEAEIQREHEHGQVTGSEELWKRQDEGDTAWEETQQQADEQASEDHIEEDRANEEEREVGDPLREVGQRLEEKEQAWFRYTFEEKGYKEFSQYLLEKLQICPNARWGKQCLAIC